MIEPKTVTHEDEGAAFEGFVEKLRAAQGGRWTAVLFTPNADDPYAVDMARTSWQWPHVLNRPAVALLDKNFDDDAMGGEFPPLPRAVLRPRGGALPPAGNLAIHRGEDAPDETNNDAAAEVIAAASATDEETA